MNEGFRSFMRTEEEKQMGCSGVVRKEWTGERRSGLVKGVEVGRGGMECGRRNLRFIKKTEEKKIRDGFSDRDIEILMRLNRMIVDVADLNLMVSNL
ncbi:unnamed protein product [Moneuplotes crassus]|uniref:Uncharacterized protein n=1 Tax=Euplotes crassus TaxID=5936 RepID=A0AAD1XPN1_EUPCR|nr:unnamed protein product [Moneuplotes crassus]